LGRDLGVLADLGLDQLASDLIPDGAGDVFEFGESGALGEPIGIEFAAEFPGELTQTSVKLPADCSDVLAHLASSSST
jgi:hypothetical protein